MFWTNDCASPRVWLAGGCPSCLSSSSTPSVFATLCQIWWSHVPVGEQHVFVSIGCCIQHTNYLQPACLHAKCREPVRWTHQLKIGGHLVPSCSFFDRFHMACFSFFDGFHMTCSPFLMDSTWPLTVQCVVCAWLEKNPTICLRSLPYQEESISDYLPPYFSFTLFT